MGADPGPPLTGTKAAKPAEREALGRSQGGLTTKVHMLADSGCQPLARVTSAAQRHDSLAFTPLMDRLKIARRGRGRSRTRPGQVLAASDNATAARVDELLRSKTEGGEQMGIYVRIAPGVKVRITRRGVRWAIGPRAARLRVGSGGTGVSTGAGPVSWYRPLRRRRKR